MSPLKTAQSGFSLLEILVVIFVIVMLTSIVTLNVGSGGQDIQLESQLGGLIDTAEYALDEAQFTGLDYGLLVEQEYTREGSRFTYTWQERRIDGWQEPESGKEIFAAQTMPFGVVLELEIEDSPFSETEIEAQSEDEEVIQHPQIVFYSSGETTAGVINVRSEEKGDLLWSIEWDLLGRFELLAQGKPEEEQ
jgi:prepilin-type N-terminal cleavage/methylation domain-containing protein